MRAPNTSTFRNALKYGAIFAAGIIVISLVFHFANASASTAYQIVIWLAWIAGSILLTKHFRDKGLGGVASFKKLFGFGVLIFLVQGVITGIYTYIMALMIPEITEMVLEQSVKNMVDQGLSDQEVEMSMQFVEIFAQPGVMALTGAIMTTVLGVFISLICAAIMQKQD